MTSIKLELLVERSRSARVVVSRRPRVASPEDAEDAVAEVLQIYDVFKDAWNRFTERLDQGVEAGVVRAFLEEFFPLLDTWLHSARVVESFAKDVSDQGKVEMASLKRLHGAIEASTGVEVAARDLFQAASAPPPELSEAFLQEVQQDYAAGRFRSMGDIIAELERE